MAKLFQKRVEDFTCEHCGKKVIGSGYTNHCPICLWSKHVDANPGDRSEPCGGMMEPIGLKIQGDERIIMHRCEKCGHKKTNRTSPQDDADAVIALSVKPYRINQ